MSKGRERERDDLKRITQNFHIHKLRKQIVNANRAKRFHTAVRTVNKVKRCEDTNVDISGQVSGSKSFLQTPRTLE
jgi:hypothetical protein